MSPEVLEAYIRDDCASQHTPEIAMAWQGGEPTVLSEDFFRRVVELQKNHSGGGAVRTQASIEACSAPLPDSDRRMVFLPHRKK